MAKKYEGVRERVKGRRYEIYFRPFKGGKLIFRNIEAPSLADAYYKRQDVIAEYRKELSLPSENREYLAKGFAEIWERLHQDLLADNISKKQIGKHRIVFKRIFMDFRSKYYPNIEKPTQLSLPFFKNYKNYYINELNRPRGWRMELTVVKALMNRIYQFGFCNKDVIEKLKELKKPKPNKKDFPDISKSDIRRLLTFIKSDRPDYYPVIYFMYRTGRRREETTLIKKSDVAWKGIKPMAINIRAETTKMGEKAPLACLDEELEQHMRQAAANNKTEWLFPNRHGRRCTPNRICDYLKKASQKIIGVAITPHYFRHRLVTECGKANMPIPDVKAITGIKDNEVLLSYYSHSTTEGQKKIFTITRM